jgi:hypothetical protein
MGTLLHRHADSYNILAALTHAIANTTIIEEHLLNRHADPWFATFSPATREHSFCLFVKNLLAPKTK